MVSLMVKPASRAQVRIGETTVTYLPDGHGWINSAASFPDSVPDGWAAHEAYLNADGRFPVSIGSFLIRTPGQALLVDLGLGEVDFAIPDAASFKGGMLLDSLRAEGLTPHDINKVVFTHLHHDHVGWLTNAAPAPDLPDGTAITGLTFPTARHLLAEREWRHWADHPGFPGPDQRAVLTPLADNIDSVGFIGDGDEIAPGITVMETPGHTPGHLSLLITDPAGHDDRRLVVLGDVMHCQVQVVESTWTFRFDVDPDQAVATRERMLKELEDPNTLLAAGHFAGQVFGHVQPPSARRTWATERNAIG